MVGRGEVSCRGEGGCVEGEEKDESEWESRSKGSLEQWDMVESEWFSEMLCGWFMGVDCRMVGWRWWCCWFCEGGVGWVLCWCICEGDFESVDGSWGDDVG